MCGFRSITSLPYSIFCIRNCFPPSWSARTWKKNNQCVVWRAKRKKKDTFFLREWYVETERPRKTLRDILESLHINFVYCTINATINMLTKQPFPWWKVLRHVTRSSQSIKIGIDLSLYKSIKIGRSDLIDVDYIDQSVETLVSFIDLSRLYPFHRFITEDTSVLLFILTWKLISCKQRICWQLCRNWESNDQTMLKKKF